MLGCLTNRIGVHEQLCGGVISDEGDINLHVGIAKQCWEVNRGYHIQTRGPLGAFMLCFRVSVWQELSGFKEGVLNFDSLFCELARQRGFITGIMQGVYVFHLYRWGTINPCKQIQHLIKTK